MKLEKMSNEELLYHFRMKYDMHTNGELSGDTKAIKAELLNKMNNPLEYKNCGNCGWANEGRGVCGNPISDTFDEFIYDSTLCKEHKIKDNETD